jgi:multidrug efflux pump subunit AcrA (membrane-fusion protein)
MFARGSVQVQTIKNATVVPETAVLRQSGETFLLVADNGKAKKVAVTLGLQQGAQIQVIGLPVGSQVIVQGQDRISNGAPIKVEKPVGAITASPGFAKSPDRGQG